MCVNNSNLLQHLCCFISMLRCVMIICFVLHMGVVFIYLLVYHYLFIFTYAFPSTVHGHQHFVLIRSATRVQCVLVTLGLHVNGFYALQDTLVTTNDQTCCQSMSTNLWGVFVTGSSDSPCLSYSDRQSVDWISKIHYR